MEAGRRPGSSCFLRRLVSAAGGSAAGERQRCQNDHNIKEMSSVLFLQVLPPVNQAIIPVITCHAYQLGTAYAQVRLLSEARTGEFSEADFELIESVKKEINKSVICRKSGSPL